MDPTSDSKVPLPALWYMVYHIFLPPELPQKDDFLIEHESAMLSMVITSLKRFKHHISSDQGDIVQSVLQACQNLAEVRRGCAPGDSVVEENLRRMIQRADEDGSVVPIHVRAQNAGVILGREGDSIIWELFELSPLNEAVMKCKGRLRRRFPGPAFSVSTKDFRQDGMVNTLAYTLAKMAHQSGPDTRPKVKKARQMHEEDRDTVHPKLVTELFGSMLRAVGSPAEVSRMWKNTREEVMWSHSLLPWRRSPFWLLLRVTMQLIFNRRVAASGMEVDLYKEFMVFLMARILEEAGLRSLPPDMLHVMNAKIARRVLKLNPESMSGGQYVQGVITKTSNVVKACWADAQRLARPTLDMSLANLDFQRDTDHDLPALDRYLAGRNTWQLEPSSVVFHPARITLSFPSQELPLLLERSIKDDMYTLIALEVWVATSLESWLCDHQSEVDACGRIARLIKDYCRLAKRHYTGIPEAMSRMVLTVLDLWVACDRSATVVCTLLRDYDPGIPLPTLQCLLLPSKLQMERLHRIETYLTKRREQAKYHESHIFRQFGTSTCFAARYFRTSPTHQALRSRIEGNAAQAKQGKVAEFERKKTQYDSLMSLYNNSSCDFYEVVDEVSGDSDWRHRDKCNRCRFKSQAASLKIQIHEWPLPQDTFDAMNAVFELAVPGFFGHWRDISIFVVRDVLGSQYQEAAGPRSKHTLKSFDGLRTYFTPFGGDQRIEILSEDKPHSLTHRDHKNIAHVAINEVCLNNGLRYKYFDGQTGRFTDLLESTDKMTSRCTYQLPTKSSALQMFLTRLSASPSGPAPNTVIARQNNCPEHLSLAEYHHLASIPLGFRLVWLNILLQLSMPSIDLAKDETSFVLLQVMHQAGPASESGIFRSSHSRASDPVFANTLLQRLCSTLNDVKGNWESSQTLAVLVCLATRVLSLSSESRVQEDYMAFLSRARAASVAWMNVLRDRAAHLVDESQRHESRLKAVEIALICVDTYHVDVSLLKQVLTKPGAAAVFIESCILIQQSKSMINEGGNVLVMRLYWRWKTLCLHTYPILFHAIVEDGSHALDTALEKSWSAYRPCQSWRPHSPRTADWLIQQVTASTEGVTSTVQYNLMTGELLLNGLPLSRLPSRYEAHQTYKTLFGRAVLDVMPSLMHGMQFSAKNTFQNHVVELGFDSAQDEVRIHATSSEQRYLLIPRETFRGTFPVTLVDDFVHWYHENAETVELRPTGSPWRATSTTWRLVRRASRWRLERDAATLVSVRSQTAHAVCALLESLDEPERMLLTYDHRTSMLEINIPRLSLAFYIDSHKRSVWSKQFRGMVIDPCQDVGTLIGLKHKIVLRHEKAGGRLVIVPEGKVMYERAGDHLRATIEKDSMTKYHAYRINPLLGRLKDNGSLQSILYLCYLHALTSFCLPDPFTDQTGTERALCLLSSAAVMSHDLLTNENFCLLEKIARLTPSRCYYPKNEQVMQEVGWDVRLSFFSQHGHFHLRVLAILRHVQKMSMFYPQTKDRGWQLPDRSLCLLERDNIRTSGFRSVGSGAEDHTVEEDMTYSPRDHGQSAPATNAFIFASIIYQQRSTLHIAPASINENNIWQFLCRAGQVHGPLHGLPAIGIHYDSTYLTESASVLARYWSCLHKRLPRASPSVRLSQMAWMATLAFASDSDSSILQVMASIMVDPGLASCSAPSAVSFQLERGVEPTEARLRGELQAAALPVRRCPEASLTQTAQETLQAYQTRQRTQHRRSQAQAMNTFVTTLRDQWPCLVPRPPEDQMCRSYFDITAAMKAIKPLFEHWFNNHLLRQYLREVVAIVCSRPGKPFVVHEVNLEVPKYLVVQKHRFVAHGDMFLPDGAPSVDTWDIDHAVSASNPRVDALIQQVEAEATTEHERQGLHDLKISLAYLQSYKAALCSSTGMSAANESFLEFCQQRANMLYGAMKRALVPKGVTPFAIDMVAEAMLLPRVPPLVFLQQLTRTSWPALSSAWKTCLIQYGLAITKLQQVERLLALRENSSDLMSEASNLGHTNWDPMEFPESVLLEVESNMMIRPNQAQVAREMRHPSGAHNAVMQLNMGEGKSSVIVPMVVATMADGTRLVRVIVTKPQSKQMFRLLVTKLGGLLDRRIYRMPFSRDVRFNLSQADTIVKICRECVESGGVLLMQPEHILSFKLMGIDALISDKHTIGRSLLATQKYFDQQSRDIIDESDEVFNVKFELVYTMGIQQPLEMSPHRWTVIQQVLGLVRQHASEVQSQFPDSIQTSSCTSGTFPMIRILRLDAWHLMTRLVVNHICDVGLAGFPVARQRTKVRESVFRYIVEYHVDPADRAIVEDQEICTMWIDSFRSTLLLLRGLFACGVLYFTLNRKRWRVNYGHTLLRSPRTRLAVPYMAKDCPTMRSEFSHPDVVVILTCLHYYYLGIDHDDLYLAFKHLTKSDQADLEFQEWVAGCSGLPPSIRQLRGINIKDRAQFTQEVFPSLWKSKAVIDYFLSHIVFPREMRSFPTKLSVSGWDIGQVKTQPCTGFSGTNDSRKLLPLGVSYLDLPDQRPTNALVLDLLLQPKNCVARIGRTDHPATSSTDVLLSAVVRLDPAVRVVLDVGAQVIELSNVDAARQWLSMITDHAQTQAAIYFNEDDELCVVDRRGQVEILQSSIFVDQLDLCLVFLDEAHTRGTDLKLPHDYRAAVTIGPNVTKDKLVQACMRMRRLSQGQSVVFCLSPEMENTLLEDGSTVDLVGILRWAIKETNRDLQQSIPLWAAQGRRFIQQCSHWKHLDNADGTAPEHELELAEKFLEPESQTIEQRYRPLEECRLESPQDGTAHGAEWNDLISRRCAEFSLPSSGTAGLQEEQERELAPEIEQERQVQRPAPTKARRHSLHPDLLTFVTTGVLHSTSNAWQPAFETLRRTSAGSQFDTSQFPNSLLATLDFSQTVETRTSSYQTDHFQRPVQWILTAHSAPGHSCSGRQLLLISPYEAQELIPHVESSSHVTLHLYAPRLSPEREALDDLNLYTIPARSPAPQIPSDQKILLNLFAGQLYFRSFQEYTAVCNSLGLAWTKSRDEEVVAADGFITSGGNPQTGHTFRESPVPFLKTLMMRIRRNCEHIDKTHMGRVLDAELLQPSDFEDVRSHSPGGRAGS